MNVLKYLVGRQATVRRAVSLMRDARVPSALKIGTVVAAVLIVSPLDVFGDVPIVGFIDDAVLLTLLLAAFVWMAQRVSAKEQQAIAGLPRAR